LLERKIGEKKSKIDIPTQGVVTFIDHVYVPATLETAQGVVTFIDHVYVPTTGTKV